MAAEKRPNNDLPTNPQRVTKEYIPGQGENKTWEWNGTAAEVEAKYNQLKGSTPDDNISSVTFENNEGRARCMARFEFDEQVDDPNTLPEGQTNGCSLVEELYAVDVIKDICEAPYWLEGTALTDEQIVWIRFVSEERYTEAEITNEAPTAPLEWENWSDKMKNLRYHILHGVTSYYETGFVVRRVRTGIRNRGVSVAFTGINRIDTSGAGLTFSTYMVRMLQNLPSGQYLKRPPQAEYLGRGKWRVSEEWHYAAEWSVVYNGSWGYSA